MEDSPAVTDPVPALEETEITSVVETGPGPAQRMGNNASGGAGDSEASSPWSLTEEKQVRNLEYNWNRFLSWNKVCYTYSARKRFHLFPELRSATIVAKLRDDPCLDSYDELESDSLSGRGISRSRMTSLDAAILMEDLKMVVKILKSSSIAPDKLIQGPLVVKERVMGRLSHTISSKKISTLYTPLHLAVASGNMDIIDVLLEQGANINGQDWFSHWPLDYACKIKSVDILLKLLARDKEEKKHPLHIAVRHGDIDFMKTLPSPNVNATDCDERTPLHYLAAYCHHNVDTVKSIIKYLVEDKKLDIKALDSLGLTPFYVAILCCNTQFVIALLDSFKNQIRLNEACSKSLGPPIQIACEGGDKFKDIEAALMECNPVKSLMERLYRDRQVYVDAANAILVGAALIASVTFASWLQPPLNYTSSSGEGYSSSSTSDLNYADVEHNTPLRVFWVFNALSFYFAIATVVSGARSVLPRSHLFIKHTVEKLRVNLLVTSVLLACSVLFVIIAFAIAGTIVLTPLLKYQWCMIVPTLIGGMLCIVSLIFLVKSMVENSSNTHEFNNSLKDLEGKDYLGKIKLFDDIRHEKLSYEYLLFRKSLALEQGL